MSWARVYVPVLIGFDLRVFKVERDDGLIASIIARGNELWKRIQNHDPPDPDYAHATTFETLKRLHGIAEGKVIDLSPEAAIAWAESKQLGEQIKELEERQKELKARVLFEMADAAIGRMPGKEIVRSHIPGSTYTAERKPYTKLYERKAK
jgi:predicted phage-related endonuclease